MSHKYNQKLPTEVEAQLDQYIERIKAIKWFRPSKDLKKADVETHLNLVLETFGVKASVEYRKLKIASDWDAAWGAARDAAWGAARDAAWGAARGAARDAARDAARGAARDAAWGAARDAARDAAWGAARDAAWGAARDAAWGAAWGANDLLVQDLEDYKKKYPKGSFINLIPLWEIGLYPIGIVDGKFVIYIPPTDKEFPDEFNET